MSNLFWEIPTYLCPMHYILSTYVLSPIFLEIPTYPKIGHPLWTFPYSVHSWKAGPDCGKLLFREVKMMTKNFVSSSRVAYVNPIEVQFNHMVFEWYPKFNQEKGCVNNIHYCNLKLGIITIVKKGQQNPCSHYHFSVKIKRYKNFLSKFSLKMVF